MRYPVTGEMLDRAMRRWELDMRGGEPPSRKRQARVIAFSREVGTGGLVVAGEVAQALGWTMWDKDILEVLATESLGDFERRMFDRLDEKTQSGIDAFVLSMLGYPEKHTYFYLLPRAIYTIAHADSVIVGRGAHMLLPDSLRVRLVGSPERRLAIYAEEEGLSREEAAGRMRAEEKERAAFLKEMKNKVMHPASQSGTPEFDLVVSVDHLGPSQVAKVVLAAARGRFGLP